MLVQNVTFLYVKIQKPSVAYNQKDLEYTIDAVLSKSELKTLKKECSAVKFKEFDNEEFTEKFGIAAPFPDQDSQYIVKFRKYHTRNGKEMAGNSPRVIQEMEDGKRFDVTQTKLVGNGSRGDISIVKRTHDEFGGYVQLKDILVKHMLEYIPKSFEDDDFGDVPKESSASNTEKETTKQKPKPKQSSDYNAEDDIPF